VRGQRLQAAQHLWQRVAAGHVEEVVALERVDRHVHAVDPGSHERGGIALELNVEAIERVGAETFIYGSRRHAAQGIAGTFIVKIVGSYSNIVGLPLYETMSLLGGEGYPIRFGWLNAT